MFRGRGRGLGCCQGPGPGQLSAVWGLGYVQTVCGDSFDEAVATTGLTGWLGKRFYRGDN